MTTLTEDELVAFYKRVLNLVDAIHAMQVEVDEIDDLLTRIRAELGVGANGLAQQ